MAPYRMEESRVERRGEGCLGTMGALIAAMSKARSDDGMRMATWNPRWMVSPHTEQGAAQTRRVQKAIGAGIVVALQETHWTANDMAVWSGLFPGAEVVPLRRGRGQMGGRKEEWHASFL